VRRPALLRQVFAVAAASPAQIVSLQKLQGQLREGSALETIAHYLHLLEEAYLVAALEKHSARATRRRAAPPKLVTLDNALLAVVDVRGQPERAREPERFGAWVENACLAFAYNAGQRVSYWREEPLEIDGVLEGSWGKWAIEVKTGAHLERRDLLGLAEFTRREPSYRPLVVCEGEQVALVERLGMPAVDWRRFLLSGPVG
jgi:predicted AAA+ superfamily ATPase